MTFDESDSAANVVRQLEDAGMVVVSVLDDLGIVRGTISTEGIDALRAIAAVEAVEIETLAASLKIPPPGNTRT